MNRLIVGGAAGAALLASALVAGSAASAQTPAAQTQPITACGTIDAAGSYIVGADLQSATGDCIDIAAPNASLDLGNHTIDGCRGDGGGVHILAGADNARVVNGTVSSFVYGVEADAPFAHIIRMTLTDNVSGGVLLRNADNSRIARSYALDNGAYGLAVQSSNGVSIVDSGTAGSGTYGIWLDDASYSFVAGNRVGPAGSAGIFLGCSPSGDIGEVGCASETHNLIEQNSVDAGNGIGIVLGVQADTNTVAGNVNSNGTYGAFDANATCGSNVWQGNRFTAANATCID
jgi:hypothetical protein